MKDHTVIRPQQWFPALLLAAFCAIAAMLVREALLRHDAIFAWGAVFLGVLLLPVFAWYRRARGSDAGTHGGRAAASAPKNGRAFYAMVWVAIALIGASLLVLHAAFAWTLFAQRLFNVSAALGLAAGLALGAAAGRRIAPRLPALAIAGAGLSLMLAVPALAMLANARFAPRRWHTAQVKVLAHRITADRHGAQRHELTLAFDGVEKRFFPSSQEWEALPRGDTFSACLREGALGSPIIVRLNDVCPFPG
jgi:hypothetical protein